LARVGILGGTFNPPHLGHLVCAGEARRAVGLDRVVLVPAAQPPHKHVGEDPGPQAREAMCVLAVAGLGGLAVSRVELERPGPSYTVDTLRVLHEQWPEDDLTFIVGGDVARSLPAWREPDQVLSLAGVAVAERSGAARDAIVASLRDLPGAERLQFFDMPRVDISSSLVRRRVAEGGPFDHLVPGGVGSYIRGHGLYGAGEGAF